MTAGSADSTLTSPSSCTVTTSSLLDIKLSFTSIFGENKPAHLPSVFSHFCGVSGCKTGLSLCHLQADTDCLYVLFQILIQTARIVGHNDRI